MHLLYHKRPVTALALIPLIAGCVYDSPRPHGERPNVILIMTDDQGHGDFGFHGNPVLRTPHLDAMARRGAQLGNFHVHGVCTPTRAALMTGRHPQRTRAFDTFMGRAMMDPNETTVAEALQRAGYATGIFGKWHLGDCYPMRAMDQGFQEALVHLGGGIGQSSDPAGGEGKYTDPILHHNGEPVAQTGYCTDVYFDAAIDWMKGEVSRGQPFFTYLATNAPHGPFHDVPQKLYDYYKGVDLSHTQFPQDKGAKLTARQDLDKEARIYAMVENIDQNIGKLFEALDELNITRDTLVLFLIDNGPNTRRYVSGFRGQKNRVYEGGVRSPLIAHWPGKLRPGAASDKVCAHYDLMPTILEACGVQAPRGLDGRSLWPLLERRTTDWADRAIVIQHHRGDRPVRYHNFMVRTQRYKMVNPTGFHKQLSSARQAFELYDMQADPYELHDISGEAPGVVAQMRDRYNRWFEDIIQTPGLGSPPPIYIGSDQAPRVVLTRQDMKRVQRQGWGYMGYWLVNVIEDRACRLTIRARGKALPTEVHVKIGTSTVQQPWGSAKTRKLLLPSLPQGVQKLEVDVTIGGKRTAAYQVEVNTE